MIRLVCLGGALFGVSLAVWGAARRFVSVGWMVRITDWAAWTGRILVGGHAGACEVIHSYKIWSIHHITLIEWDRISIPESSSLHHYTTGMVQGLYEDLVD